MEGTDKINCAIYWLDEAIKLHKIHMEYPSTATQESQELMMRQIVNARRCLAD